MLTTIACLVAATLAPAQSGSLKLANVRTTHGVLGPTRPDNKILPGDLVCLAFDIEGFQVDAAGKVAYGVGLEVSAYGNVLFKKAPSHLELALPSSKSIPACAKIEVGLDQPAGKYNLKVTVADRTAGTKTSVTRSYEILPPGFGIVRLSLTSDREGKTAAAAFSPGRPAWINFAVVGFGRDNTKGQPRLTATMRVFDQFGRPALSTPTSGTISQGVPATLGAVPMQFELALPRTGLFTVELKATDQITGRQSTMSFPIQFVASKVAAHRQAGTCLSETATFLRRSPGDKTWHIVAHNEPLPEGDLLVALPGATLDSRNGAVRVALLADLDRLSPYPIRESAVQLHNSANVDLDVTLDRGRVEFTNQKQTGAATVRVSVRQNTWEIKLGEPGARIGLELYGRWPPGVPFQKEPDPKHQPTANLLFLALKGHIMLEHDGEQIALHAPPGPALLEWDSVTGMDDSPQRLDTLPAWANTAGKETAVAKKKKQVIERFRRAVIAKSIDGALDEFLNSNNEQDRTLAIFAMAALDKLDRLGKALREAKHPDVWETGILALRHWIGRAPGQDQILYKGLIEVAHYKPVHAETVLQLLHSFGEEELASPETYQTLIDYLDHDQLAIRGLAHWHLYRLVPAGRDIGYNPLAPKEARVAAIQKWRKLLPPGSLPPRPAAK